MLNNLSYWEKATYFESINFAIIGSGIVGLNAAIKLRELYPKAKIIVLERGILPSGASTKNAGFACFGSVSELIDDIDTMGLDAVMTLVEKRWRGLKRLRQRCGDQLIDYQQYGGYELFLKEDAYYQKCVEFIPYLNQHLAPIIGQKEVFSIEKKTTKFGFGKVKKMIFNQAEGQINPARMMERLQFIAQQKNISIYTGVTVTKIGEEGGKVHLEIGEGSVLTADKVLVATNGFTKKLLPNLKLQPARNQVVITEPIHNLNIKGTFHFEEGYYYFRNFENRILLGGARNKAKVEETTNEFGLTPLIQNTLETFLKEIILPNQSFEIEHRWSGILGVGAQKAPIVKKYSEHIGVAVRLGGMGVAIGSLVGEEGALLL